MRTSLKARLLLIMRDLGWSQTDLAKAAKASQPTASRWLKDGQIRMDAEFAFNLQDESGYSARWIALGQGPMKIRDVAERILRESDIRGRMSGKN